MGVRRGHGVAFLSSNRPELSLAVGAVLTLGGRVTLLNPMLGPERLDQMVATATVDVLVFDPLVEQLALGLGEHAGVTLLALGPSASARDLLAEAERQPDSDVEIEARPEDIAFVHFTSGSTGPAKAATFTQQAAALGALLTVANGEWPEDVRFLACSGMAQYLQLPVRLRGGCMYLQNGFDPVRVRETVLAEGITATYLTPAMLLQLARQCQATGPLPSLSSLFYAGAVAAPAHLREAVDTLGPVLVQAYSQIEANTWVSLLSRREHLTGPLDSAGRPLPGVQVRVLDEQGLPVPRSSPGEICLDGPTLTQGYWNDPDATRRAHHSGWLRTGDLGCLDEQGYLHVFGRREDRLSNTSPPLFRREIEDRLCAHADVADAAVVDGPAGHVVVSVVARGDREIPADELRRLLPEGIEVRFRFVAALPLAASGKVNRLALREAALADAVHADD